MPKPIPKAENAPTRVVLLGATGSIGASTLKVMEHAGGRFSLAAATAMDNVEALIEIARTHRPALAVIGNEAHYPALKAALSGTGVAAAAGAAAIEEAACAEADIVVSAIVGAAGLKPTLAAVSRGRRVALANKECLVAAGGLLMRAAARAGATLLPVDSEHSGVFQVFSEAQRDQVERVTLTASGGPFRAFTLKQMQRVTPAEAVRHPNWSMGAKISVDSATLMNKGLELIEAHHLFSLPGERLGVLIHPESIVHCLVEYADGSVLAQMSRPDMVTPIACALAWPERMAAPAPKLDLAALGRLTFGAPDEARFPALALAMRALAAGQGACIALNAANEVAVQAFLAGRTGFLEIAKTVEKTLEKAENGEVRDLQDVLARDAAARRLAEEFLP